MPVIKQVVDCRCVDMDLVPEGMRLDMLRTQIKFRTEDPNGPSRYMGDAPSEPDVVEAMEAALHEHTRGLFTMITDRIDHFGVDPQVEFRVFFENTSDKKSFLQNYLTLQKLSN